MPYIYLWPIFKSLREAQQFFAFTLLTLHFVLVPVTDSTFCFRRKRKGLYNLSYAICLNKPSLFLDFKKIQKIGLGKFGNPSSFYRSIINYIQLLLLLLLFFIFLFKFLLLLYWKSSLKRRIAFLHYLCLWVFHVHVFLLLLFYDMVMGFKFSIMAWKMKFWPKIPHQKKKKKISDRHDHQICLQKENLPWLVMKQEKLYKAKI